MHFTGPPHSLPPILVVDDEEAVLCSLRDTLAREGHRVSTAPGAIEALAMLKENTFSVVISDQRMPGLTGLEFLAQVRELQPQATRILITGVVSLEVVIDAINKGEIYRFVVKPWIREELLGTVQNAVQRFSWLGRHSELQESLAATKTQLADAHERLRVLTSQLAGQGQELDTLRAALALHQQGWLDLCLRAMETFHPALGEQARRTRELSRAMAIELKYPAAEVEVLECSACLHDIGMLSVPRPLLRQWESAPETLTEAELSVIRQHPVLGEKLVEALRPQVAPLIRAHHENFDGSGYPDGLRGAAIPPLARLLTVASAYVQSNQDRASTVAWLEQQSGRLFDPEALEAFRRCLSSAGHVRGHREVSLTELRPGMVVAHGIYNAQGHLLVSDGESLTEGAIRQLNHHSHLWPDVRPVTVYH
jgi:response regulator RpfG family c-di-GMP phosphodiesterase